MENENFLRLLGQASIAAKAAIARDESDQAQAEALRQEQVERKHQHQLADLESEAQRVRDLAKRGIQQALQLGHKNLAVAQQSHTEQLVRVVTTATISASKGSAAAAAAGAAAAVEAGKTKSGPQLSVVVTDYLRERSARGAGNLKTRLKLKAALQLLMDGVGDMPINQITRASLTAFLERLRRLPSNVGKKTALAGLTFVQLTEPEAILGPVVAHNTVNGHMTRISGMFKWARTSGDYLLTVNPAAGLTIAKPEVVKRRPFKPDQLVALFSHESFSNRRFMHPHYFWLMPIAALTGMRLNEVCQLQLADFQQVDGVDFMSCADLDEGRKGKNDNARRQVPIHDQLVRLGLLRWVDQLRSRGEVQLFPELKAGRDGHGQAPSKWFQGYRAACGIDGRQVYVFHSFRHYFINRCLAAGELPHNIAAIAGHETGLITVDIYGQDFDMTVLQAAVNKVTLPPEVLALVPPIEDCTFTKKPTRRPPSRLGARKSREKRNADAVARRSKQLR